MMKILSQLFLALLVTACASTPPESLVSPNPVDRGIAETFTLPREVAQRAKQLAQNKDVATGKKWRSREALGGARLEAHLQGRKITPGLNTSVDWVDQKLGDISLKGPLVDDRNYDGVLEALEGFDLEAVKNAIRRDLGENPKAPTLVVDTLGLSDGEIRFLESEILKLPNPFKKTIFLLREREMKVLTQKFPSSSYDRYTNQ